MPCTPERVWRAIEDARAGTLADPWREPPAAFADLMVRERRPASRAQRDEEELDL
jgi:aerobic carbon-monoxide dehydrogenase large subunit